VSHGASADKVGDPDHLNWVAIDKDRLHPGTKQNQKNKIKREYPAGGKQVPSRPLELDLPLVTSLESYPGREGDHAKKKQSTLRRKLLARSWGKRKKKSKITLCKQNAQVKG